MIIGKPTIFDIGSENVKLNSNRGKNLVSDYDEDDEIDIFNFDGMNLDELSELLGDDDDDDDEKEPEEEKVMKAEKKKKKKKAASKVVSVEKVKETKEADKAKAKAESVEKARKRAEKKRLEFEREKHEAEIDIIRLQTRREYLRATLSKLNPGKRKDAVKIVNINIELRTIDSSIADLRTKFNISNVNVDRGSGITRFFNSAVRGAKRVFGKVSKFFRKHKEMILGLASIILPVVGSAIAASIIR